jgi:hypothetical protein
VALDVRWMRETGFDDLRIMPFPAAYSMIVGIKRA